MDTMLKHALSVQKAIRVLLTLAVFVAMFAATTAQADQNQIETQKVNSVSYAFAVYLPNLSRTSESFTLLLPKDRAGLKTLIPLFSWNTSSGIIWPGNTTTCLAVGTKPHPEVCGDTPKAAVPNSVMYAQLPYNLQPNTTYYWRVGTVYGSDSKKFWSVENSFQSGTQTGVILPGPELTSPAINTIIRAGEVKLTWLPVNNAIAYRVVLHSLDKDLEINLPQVNVQEATITGLDGFCAENGNHFTWYVVARNAYAWGSKSAAWTFAYQKP